MRFVKITIGGKPTSGDVVIAYYRARAGGQTETAYVVQEGDGLDRISEQIAAGMNTHWCKPLFRAKADGNVIMLGILEGAEDVELGYHVTHIVGVNHLFTEPGGTETIAFEEL